MNELGFCFFFFLSHFYFLEQHLKNTESHFAAYKENIKTGHFFVFINTKQNKIKIITTTKALSLPEEQPHCFIFSTYSSKCNTNLCNMD